MRCVVSRDGSAQPAAGEMRRVPGRGVVSRSGRRYGVRPARHVPARAERAVPEAAADQHDRDAVRRHRHRGPIQRRARHAGAHGGHKRDHVVPQRQHAARVTRPSLPAGASLPATVPWMSWRRTMANITCDARPATGRRLGAFAATMVCFPRVHFFMRPSARARTWAVHGYRRVRRGICFRPGG